MLRDLLGAQGVDDAEARSDDDVGNGGVLEWVAEALGDETRAVDDVFDFESGFVGLQTGDGFGGGGLVGEPEEGERVGGLLEDFDARGVGDGVRVDPDELAGVDGGLTVLGGDDEERLAVDSLVLEALDDLAEGLVDEVVGGEESGREGCAVFGFVTSFLFGDVDGLEVAAEEAGGFAC